jgi:hypothetical protein
MQGDQVRFTFRNRQQGDRSDIAQLDAHAWIKRFLLMSYPRALFACAIMAC